MSGEWSVPGWAVLAALAVLVVLVVVLSLALVRSRRRVDAVLEQARAESAALAASVAAIERRLAATPHDRPGPDHAPRTDPTEYVVTMLGREEEVAEPAPVVAAPLFADLVLRESAVQAASLAAGLRRALAPETRHRIRLEMRREVKRARKQRRADLRQARRDLAARQRAGLDPHGIDRLDGGASAA